MKSSKQNEPMQSLETEPTSPQTRFRILAALLITVLFMILSVSARALASSPLAKDPTRTPRPTGTPPVIPPPADPTSTNLLIIFAAVIVTIILLGIWINRRRAF